VAVAGAEVGADLVRVLGDEGGQGPGPARRCGRGEACLDAVDPPLGEQPAQAARLAGCEVGRHERVGDHHQAALFVDCVDGRLQGTARPDQALQVEAEDVGLLRPAAGHLLTGDDGQTGRLTPGDGLGDRRHGVVVGDRDQAQASPDRGGDQLGGCGQPIGGRGVTVGVGKLQGVEQCQRTGTPRTITGPRSISSLLWPVATIG